MDQPRGKHQTWARFAAWVDGEWEPKDQTLYVMELRRSRRVRPSEAEHEKREWAKLSCFFNWHPFAAAVLSVYLTLALCSAAEELMLRGEMTILLLLFGLGLFLCLLSRSLPKKLIGLDLMGLSACVLLALMAPGGIWAALAGLGLLLLFNGFALPLFQRLHHRFGTLELSEIMRREEE